ncbi:class I SAM-dependent DNA methyltransferase [Brevibacillus dissolubilis]|uniref:class I SAM-dependent DNA methyltransferase n=1 Tax=Brevibacillus dissolubilis TaxID=1844116 RepID=UPI00111606AB|nr:class I SAM-dependent methyltransferase [Brevibacillus dissolubilis]
MSYTHLAAIYDQLMAETPYDTWIAWAEKHWQQHGKPQSIIDLGCGTGNIAIPLAQKGYQVTGVDLSSEMLTAAEAKARAAGVRIHWTEQDMCDLELPVADAIISFLDCISYVTEEEDVKAAFANAFAHLRPGGTFLFDVHSPYKILEFFGNHTFTLLEDGINYVWQCFCDPLRIEVEHQLTFFIQQPNGLYERLEEDHLQRAYQPMLMQKWLKDAGFVDITITADFTDEPPQHTSERLFFTARRPE